MGTNAAHKEAQEVVEALAPHMGRPASLRLLHYIRKVGVQAQAGMAKKSELHGAVRRGYRQIQRTDRRLQEFHNEFQEFQKHVDGEFKEVRKEMNAESDLLNTELKGIHRRILWVLGVGAGLVYTLEKLLAVGKVWFP